MSENLNKISMHSITAPSLKQVDYAEKLEGVFENINHNFSVLANPEFTRGEKGESLNIRDVEFFDENGLLNDLGNKLIQCIKSISTNQSEYNDVVYYEGNKKHTLSIFDNFYANPGSIKMIYDSATDYHTAEPISSLYYVFLDGRYANNVIGKIDESNYSSVRDMSSIVVYDKANGGFKVLPNAFPTIYYEKGLGLCWKVNGANTGIPVKGAPGKDGHNSTLYIVKCNSAEVNNGYIRGIVNSIYGLFDGYTEIESADLSQYNNQTAVISITEGDNVGFYFGYLEHKKLVDEDGNTTNALYANCDQNTAIDVGMNTQNLMAILKNINLLNDGNSGSDGLKGIFIPIRSHKDGKQPVHLMSAASVSNTDNPYNELIFAPVSDIDKLNVSDVEGKSLKVDRYLYVKVNTNSGIFNEQNSEILNKSNFEKNYGGMLKYRLRNIVTSVNSIGDNLYDKRFGFTPYMPDVPFDRLSDKHVAYYSTLTKEFDVNKDTFTLDHKYTIPKNFASRLSGFSDKWLTSSESGIYCWELCNDRHDFDVPELLKYEGSKYALPNSFKVIYTTTMTPDIDSDIMWFNGFEFITGDIYGIHDEYNTNGYIASGPSAEFNNRFVIPGWNAGSNNILSFVKFVPVCDNDFAFNGDTALNLNYNVNVIGPNNTNKSVTVRGPINCKNVLVDDGLSFAKAIEYSKITTLCKDGIIMKSGKNVFGIGEVDNVPVLFYDNGSNSANNTISLDDLFGFIKEWKSFKKS